MRPKNSERKRLSTLSFRIRLSDFGRHTRGKKVGVYKKEKWKIACSLLKL